MVIWHFIAASLLPPPTSELADLLGLTPGTITDYGEEFSDAGFTFSRAGKRKGGEIAWRIGKPKRTK